MNTQENVRPLVEEYRVLIGNADSWKSLEGALVSEGDWSHEAAMHLIKLVKLYGSFMLRNALALAVALDKEDGDLKF